MCANKKYVIKQNKEVLAICWHIDSAKELFKEFTKLYKNVLCIIYEGKEVVGWFNEDVYVLQLNLFDYEFKDTRK